MQALRVSAPIVNSTSPPQVLNAGNSSVGGATTSGFSAPRFGSISATNSNSATTNSTAQTVTQKRDTTPKEERRLFLPSKSLATVEAATIKTRKKDARD